MTLRTLVGRSLTHYWRIDLAVVMGVATAVGVLAGALIVGVSVRASLRESATARLGRTDVAVAGAAFFREALATDLASVEEAGAAPASVVPLIALEGAVTHDPSGRTAHGVQVYGVDDRFWRFHDVAGVAGPEGRAAFLSPALRSELAPGAGDPLILTLQQPSDIPAGVLQGRRDEVARTIRLDATPLPAATVIAEFTLRPQQGAIRAVFAPLSRLQRDLDQEARANLLLIRSAPGAQARRLAATIADHLRAAVRLDDIGLRLRTTSAARPALIVESTTGYLSEAQAAAIEQFAASADLQTNGVLTYLANTIRVGNRAIPYSTVSAIELPQLSATHMGGTPPIVLTQWAANELRPVEGETVTLEFYVWDDQAGLETRRADFRYHSAVPMEAPLLDATLTPEYPGLTDASRMSGWDPPFPVDLSRIRKQDEDYWERYRATPKAFVALEAGQVLWGSPFGQLTSIRLTPAAEDAPDAVAVATQLARSIDPLTSGGIAVLPVRETVLAAAEGTTDFGEYFLYFSAFLVASGLMLAGLFFRLSVEQRAREIGVLRAVGYPERTVAGLFIAEGGLLAVAGSLLGCAAAVAYAAVVMFALRTWWVGAVGTTDLALHVTPGPLVAGLLAGVAAAVLTLLVALRGAASISPRQLLTGGGHADSPAAFTSPPLSPLAPLTVAIVAIGGAVAGVLPPIVGFFVGGVLLLAAGFLGLSRLLRRARPSPIVPAGAWSLARLGFRAAAVRPGRAVLAAALIGFATFTIVSVGAFRAGPEDESSPESGTGGYAFVATSAAPLVHDPNTPRGRDALALPPDVLGSAVFTRFRLKPGDDASCLNLYRPQNPRLLGVPAAFAAQGRFSFVDSLASTSRDEENPWRLLDAELGDDAIPAIADATSLRYVFGRGVGEELVVPGPGGGPVRLRFVAALRDSVFQSEVLIAERHFVRLFPRLDGYRFFLIDADAAAVDGDELERAFADFGLDVESTAARLAAYHRVENTYLSTFQTLGGLGLVLGIFGVGAVLLRNVLERQRELALLAAIGFRQIHISAMIVSETVLLVLSGVAIGAAAGLLAVAPALSERATPVPAGTVVLLIAGVGVAALCSSLAATAAVRRMPLLTALRTE